MSVQTQALKGAVHAADDDLGSWLKGLVSGQGDSPSQVIISGILSVVPGLGQAMDLRDIVVGVITIASAPSNPMVWLDISITLVGCVPIMGDGLKTGFRLMKSGKAMPRILDGLSPSLRGDINKWFKNIDWADISRTVKSTFDDILAAFIDGLDSWLARIVMGKDEVRNIIRQLEAIRKDAPRMLDEAIEELKRLYKKAMGDTPPKSTAAQGTPTAPHAPDAAPAAKKADAPQTVKRDKTADSADTPDKAHTDERRASKKKDSWQKGVMAEHITDYWCARNKRNLKKANNRGRLWEEYDMGGRTGIDHVWVQATDPVRPGVIGETKSSLLGAFRFMSALPTEIRDQLKELGDTEGANPTDGGTPNVFDSEGRDGVDPGKVRVGGDAATEDELKKGLGKENPETNLPTQMSHRWIIRTLPRENLTPAGLALAKKVSAYEKRYAAGLGATPPYSRWIIMVTGRQKALHGPAKGHRHEIQKPLITLPDNILDK